MIKAFRKVKLSDRESNSFQDAVAQVLGPLSKVAISGGVQITGVVLAAGDNKIDHFLNQTPQGWFLVDQNSAAAIYRSDWNDKQIILHASATTTVSIWIY